MKTAVQYGFVEAVNAMEKLGKSAGWASEALKRLHDALPRLTWYEKLWIRIKNFFRR